MQIRFQRNYYTLMRKKVFYLNNLFFTAVNRSNFAFDATFSELAFLKHENLKRAQLRFNIPQSKQCSLPELSIRVVDDQSGQVLGNCVMSPQKSGINTLVLTKSLRKLALNLSPEKKLKVRVALRNPSAQTSPCTNVVGALSREAYLVTNTDEIKTRKRRFSGYVPNIFRRPKRNVPTCNMRKVNVNLTNTNNVTFILPQSFQTGVCGPQRPVPSSNDPMIQELAQAISRAAQTLPPSSNAHCCVPSGFQKELILYYNNNDTRHVILRYVDKVKVTSCACPNST